MTATVVARVVAIDGPAGAGKSTVARRLADALGFVLLDTGALYRALALAAERRGIPWDDEAAVSALSHEIVASDGVRLEPDPSSPRGVRVVLLGEDVSGAIRTQAISMGASCVSAIAGVRAALLELQRHLGQLPPGVVAEGRDIGTVVFPDAPVKFFLTASLEVRARRRQAELEAQGQAVPPLAQTLEEVAARDRQDSERAVAPLRRADDAHLVDSTGRGIDEVVSEMKRVVDDVLDG
jgi:cytidylate kinase